MKKILIVTLAIILAFPLIVQGQSNKNSIEVLYFKANLACCRARACNMLEADVKAVIEKNFPNGNVVFTTIRIADASNKELVEKYSAKSQTVVIVRKKRKKEYSVDVSNIVAEYARNRNKIEFETELINNINSVGY